MVQWDAPPCAAMMACEYARFSSVVVERSSSKMLLSGTPCSIR